jgi:hypothetical protein
MTYKQFINAFEDMFNIQRYGDHTHDVSNVQINAEEIGNGVNEITLRFRVYEPAVENLGGDSGPAREGGSDGD